MTHIPSNPASYTYPSPTNMEWQQLLPGGDTICSGGTKYAFFVRRTGSAKLLVFFQPGGASLEGAPDDPQDPLFDPSVVIDHDETSKTGTIWDRDDPANMDGIFNLADERNPFSDYNMVFIPYCTGDVHLGNNIHDGIYHKGYINAMSALAWTYKNFLNPKKIFVAGSSAGVIGASYYVGLMAEHYYNAEIAMLGDSLGGLRASVTETLQNWGALNILLSTPSYDHLSEKEIHFYTPYLVNTKRFPHISFAQFNTTEDFAQLKSLKMMGVDEPLVDLLKANHADIHAGVNNFYTYTVNDNYHVILRKPKFYQEQVDGVYFYEWVRALANGEAVENMLH